MRGKIIQYDGNSGNGTIIADGQQYRFAIGAWRADSAPSVGRVVELAVEGSEAQTVTSVPDDVLLKEKAAEFGVRLNRLAGRVATSAAAAASSAANSTTAPAGNAAPAIAGSAIARYGKPMLGAYALFLVGSLFLDAVSISFGPVNKGWSLFDVAGFLGQMGGGGGSVKLLLMLAYAAAALPLAWIDRRAWLGLALPLLAFVWAIGTVLHAAHGIDNGMGGGMASAMGDEISNMFHLGMGFYLSMLSALVLAGGGVLRFLRNT